MSTEVKKLDTDFPYVEKIGSKLSSVEISQIEERYGIKLFSIKTIAENKTRYGFKRNES